MFKGFTVKIDSELGMRLYHAARARGLSMTLLANKLIKDGVDKIEEQHEEQQGRHPTSNTCVASGSRELN